MKLTTFLLLGAASLSLAACGGSKQPSSSDNAGVAATLNTSQGAVAAAPGPGQSFANKAAASDAFEIATSQLALEKSSSDSIKRFATHMVKAHTESTDKLKAVAASAVPAIVPDPTLSPEQQSKLVSLRAANGSAFDAAFVAEQRTAHDMTLAMLRDYATNGDVAPMKVFAAEMVPVVTAHVNMAKSLKP